MDDLKNTHHDASGTVHSPKLITIVCPVYNEEESIPIFYGRARNAIAPLQENFDFEFIFTNNRSTDRTLEVIMDLRRTDPRVQAITLSRNFGYQASMMAGLRHAAGDGIVVIDVDCEDPPEMIPALIHEWVQGYDLVYGERKKRTEFYPIHLFRLAFYRINRLIADSEIILDMAEFALMSRRIRDLLLANHSTYPFLRAEAGYVGFARKGIPYRRQARVRGKTHFNLIGMTKFAIGGMLSSSTFPLRSAAYMGFPVLGATVLLLWADLTGRLAGAFHTMVAINLLYIVSCLACLAIYLARDYKNGVSRPVFIVDWERSFVKDNRTRWRTNNVQE